MGGNNKSQQQGKDCVQGSISLRSVEWNCLGQGIETYRTGSGEYALYIITKGRGSITAGGIEYEAAEGNVLAVFPETDVKAAGNAQDLFYYIRLCSCGAQVAECAREAGFFEDAPYHLVNGMAELIKTVRSMLESEDDGYVECLEQSCRITKIWIDLIEDHRYSKGQLPHAAGNDRLKKMQEIAAYMKEHMEQDLKVEQIAKKYGMNRSGLTRQFRSAIGCPPQQYLLQVRLDRAKELLRDTEYTIGEVAARVGYRDALAFSHIFKEKCSMGPRDYRKSCIKK